MCNHLEQLRAWLMNPNRLNSRGVVNALLVLAVEDIVKYVDINFRSLVTTRPLVTSHTSAFNVCSMRILRSKPCLPMRLERRWSISPLPLKRQSTLR